MIVSVHNGLIRIQLQDPTPGSNLFFTPTFSRLEPLEAFCHLCSLSEWSVPATAASRWMRVALSGRAVALFFLQQILLLCKVLRYMLFISPLHTNFLNLSVYHIPTIPNVCPASIPELLSLPAWWRVGLCRPCEESSSTGVPLYPSPLCADGDRALCVRQDFLCADCSF